MIKKVNGFYHAGEYENAKNELNDYLKDHPNSSNGWVYLGLVNVELNDTLNAEHAYKKVLELDKENEKGMVGLGVVERMKGNYGKARTYYERVLEINASNADAYSSLLILEIKNRNYSKAVSLGETARQKEFLKTSPGILGNLVIAYHLNNQPKERDELLAELEKTSYKDIKYTKMIIDGEIDTIDLINSL